MGLNLGPLARAFGASCFGLSLFFFLAFFSFLFTMDMSCSRSGIRMESMFSSHLFSDLDMYSTSVVTVPIEYHYLIMFALAPEVLIQESGQYSP